MTPTTEQEAIIDMASTKSNNIMIHAYAGCGKSASLRMIERATPTKPVLYLAFNRRVVDEIEFKPRADPDEAARRMQSTTTVRTFNGIGHRIWSQSIGKKQLTLNAKKVPDILRQVISEAPKKHQGAMWESFWEVVNGVGMAKAVGYVPEHVYPTARRLTTPSQFHSTLDEEPDDLVADLIDVVLSHSIQSAYAGEIDFNDQVFLPAVFGGIFPRFPLVLVDEYQDLNPVNHAMLDRLCAHSRVIGVGDPNQNIYGFRGAKAAGMVDATAKFSMTEMDLSVSFRCPRRIVENVHWRVPHYKWIKEGGDVKDYTDFNASSLANNCTILSRNNAPLFALAFKLLSSGRSVSVAGSDIGPKLLGIFRKLGPEDLTRTQTQSVIDSWLAAKLDRGSSTAEDLAACMKVFASHGDSLGQAICYAEHLFKQTGTIRLMTGHKAKGLEFNHVYHLDPWLCRDDEQDKNLRYVIDTRSQDTLTYIDSRGIKW